MRLLVEPGIGEERRIVELADALGEQQRPIATAPLLGCETPAGRQDHRASCDVAASVDIAAVPVTSSDASPLLLVLSGTRASDARFAIAKQSSPADAASRWIVSQGRVRPVSPERRVVVFG